MALSEDQKILQSSSLSHLAVAANCVSSASHSGTKPDMSYSQISKHLDLCLACMTVGHSRMWSKCSLQLQRSEPGNLGNRSRQ